ncbi:MAG TPA: tetratricopeptide repeat protein, partial [Thermodesulfovibrionales bacterium]|nr:tetratricopeptide repeat protein [Thermodesulfovibrionales bacterium]
KVKQVSEELGVRYVLEGSFQKSGDRVRIGVQLVDALTGNHLWAERYERDLKDIFALQDEITIKILTGVQSKLALTGGDVSSAEKLAEKYYRGKQGLDCYMKLIQCPRTIGNIEENNLNRRLAEEAIAMCPDNPMGYSRLGLTCLMDYWLGNTKSPKEALGKGIELAQKAIALDDSIARPHALLGMLYTMTREYDKAIAEGERAVALNPGDTGILSSYAESLNYVGRQEEAIPILEKAIRLTPTGSAHLYRLLGMTLRNSGRFEEAVSTLKKAIQLAPDNIFSHLNLANTYSLMGREKEARDEAAEVLRINPKFSLDYYVKRLPFKDQSQTDKVANPLRKAGLK